MIDFMLGQIMEIFSDVGDYTFAKWRIKPYGVPFTNTSFTGPIILSGLRIFYIVFVAAIC